MSIKRFYGPLYFGLNGAVLAQTLGRLPATGPVAAAGPVLAHGAPTAFLAGLFVRRRGRASERMPLVRGAAAAGSILAALPSEGRARRVGLAALLGAAGTEAYLHWYSRLGRERSDALEVGRTFPDDVSFTGLDGAAVTGADLRGTPTAIFFYRGNWCPLCVAQVGEMAARWTELDAMGVRVALISPQDDEHTRTLSDRFGVPFTYLRDPGLQAARRLGLLHQGGTVPGMPGYEADTVFPTVVVTDAAGRIVLSDQTDDYRVRPEPETILAALRAAA